MNNDHIDKLHDALADILTKATQTAGEAKDFALAQAPDVIHQLLTWKLWENIFLAIVCFGFGLFILKKVLIWRAKIIEENYDELAWIFWTASLLIVIVIGVFGLASVLDATQIILAPKVYLLEYAKGLIK